jgi:hypothetical protein
MFEELLKAEPSGREEPPKLRSVERSLLPP